MRLVLLLGISVCFFACANAVVEKSKTTEEVKAEKSDLGEDEAFASRRQQRITYEREVGFKPTPQKSLYLGADGILKAELISEKFQKAEREQAGVTQSETSENKSYTLQFEVVADVDVAQKRRWAVTQKTGLGAYLLFDSPFYKIRAGKWSSKEEAEDAALQYNAMGISAILIEL